MGSKSNMPEIKHIPTKYKCYIKKKSPFVYVIKNKHLIAGQTHCAISSLCDNKILQLSIALRKLPEVYKVYSVQSS